MQQNGPAERKFRRRVAKHQSGEKGKRHLKQIGVHDAEQQGRGHNGKHLSVSLKLRHHQSTVDEFLADRRKNGGVQEHGKGSTLRRCSIQLSHGGISKQPEQQFQTVPEQGIDQLRSHENAAQQQKSFQRQGLSLGKELSGRCAFSEVPAEKQHTHTYSGNAGNTAAGCAAVQLCQHFLPPAAVRYRQPDPALSSQRFCGKDGVPQQRV